jgi:Zn-dependent M32 family carboxypeptidase
MIRMGPLLAASESLLRLLEVLRRLSPVSTKSERIALDDLMNDMKEIRHAQALQPFFGKLDQGLRSVTDHIQHSSAETLESLLHQGLPRGIGAIVCDLFQHQLASGEVHEDQDHAFQKRFIHGPNDLAYLPTRLSVLLPGRRRLQQRGLQRLHHPA